METLFYSIVKAFYIIITSLYIALLCSVIVKAILEDEDAQ